MEKGGGQLVDASSFVDLCTLHQHAMRYYRLWIYACNTVLAIATFIFTLFALSIVVDPRISLLSGVELYQPTFIYAYVALVLQCGVLQAIGCIGAIRLNQKLLNTYWTLLLVLMIGDILVGLVWAFRLDRIKSNLKPHLKQRLTSEYGSDSKFTQTWDWVQTNDMCCGVEGPTDFLRFNDSSSSHYDNGNSGLPFEGSMGFHPKLPSTCCTFMITYNFPTPTPSSYQPQQPKHRHSHNYSSIGSSVASTTMRSNRIMYPHYPNNNFTMHLSSFGSGSGTTHNRRKIAIAQQNTKKKIDSSIYPDSHQHSHQPHRSNVQTTTESTRRSSHPYGVCGLPPDLLTKYKSNIYIKVSDTIIDNYSFEGSGSGGGSSEEANSPEVTFSPPQQNPQLSSSATTTMSSSVISSTAFPYHSSSSTEPSVGGSEQSKWMTSPSPTPTKSPGSSSSTPHSPLSPPQNILVAMTLNEEGCGEKVLEWVDHASDVLFVIGFCIIVFLKGCFVAILRYEIKEMIQKIRLLNGEDASGTAAMNELIGLTAYNEGNDDDAGEREGLMASASGGSTQIGSGGAGGDTITSTNIDALDSDSRRKESVISKDHHNCIVGNNIGNNRNVGATGGYKYPPFLSTIGGGGGAVAVGNHVGGGSNNTNMSNSTSTTNSNTTGTATTTAGVTGSSHNNRQQYDDHYHHHHHHHNQQEIEDDFDSGSALLGGSKHYRGSNGNNPNENDNPPATSGGGGGGDRNKFKNENGGRTLPRNGNNNTTGLGGVTGSASAPIPIESMAKA